jgi:hypothetical protein
VLSRSKEELVDYGAAVKVVLGLREDEVEVEVEARRWKVRRRGEQYAEMI